MPSPTPVLLMVREPTSGGCERDLAKLARHLDPSEFSAHAAFFRPDGFRADELRAAGIPITVFPVRSLYSFATLQIAAEMRRFLREERIAIVHAFDVPTDLFAVPVARWSGVPVISCQLSFRDLYSSVHRRALRLTDRFANKIVVNSHAVEKHLINDEGISPSRIAVLHNGVETQVFFPGPAERIESLARASVVIGSLCVLREEKRLDLLLTAFAQVRATAPGAKLLIVGSGPMLASLESQSRNLNIAEDCIFEPAKADVAPWLRMMDIFVIPSESESFPNALLEAMACGCASIGSNAGGIPELIDHGRNGFIFENGSAAALASSLGELLASPERRAAFRKAAAETAHTQFSMEIHVAKTKALYRELLKRSGRGA